MYAGWPEVPREHGTAVAPSLEVEMELAGRRYIFDYGDLVLRVHYLSNARLAWTQLKGPDAGSEGEQDFQRRGAVRGVLSLVAGERQLCREPGRRYRAGSGLHHLGVSREDSHGVSGTIRATP